MNETPKWESSRQRFVRWLQKNYKTFGRMKAKGSSYLWFKDQPETIQWSMGIQRNGLNVRFLLYGRNKRNRLFVQTALNQRLNRDSHWDERRQRSRGTIVFDYPSPFDVEDKSTWKAAADWAEKQLAEFEAFYQEHSGDFWHRTDTGELDKPDDPRAALMSALLDHKYPRRPPVGDVPRLQELVLERASKSGAEMGESARQVLEEYFAKKKR